MKYKNLGTPKNIYIIKTISKHDEKHCRFRADSYLISSKYIMTLLVYA